MSLMTVEKILDQRVVRQPPTRRRALKSQVRAAAFEIWALRELEC